MLGIGDVSEKEERKGVVSVDGEHCDGSAPVVAVSFNAKKLEDGFSDLGF